MTASLIHMSLALQALEPRLDRGDSFLAPSRRAVPCDLVSQNPRGSVLLHNSNNTNTTTMIINSNTAYTRLNPVSCTHEPEHQAEREDVRINKLLFIKAFAPQNLTRNSLRST